MGSDASRDKRATVAPAPHAPTWSPRRSTLFLGYLGAVVVAALGACATVGLAGQPRASPLPVTFWVMAALAVGAEVRPFAARGARAASPPYPSTCFTVAIMIMWGLLPAVLVNTVAVAVSAALVRRPLWRAGFTVSRRALAFAAGTAVLSLGPAQPLAPGSADLAGRLPVVLGAAVAWFAVTLLLGVTAGWLRDSGSWSRIFVRSLTGDGPSTAALLLLAPVLAVAAYASGWLLPLALVAPYAVNRTAALAASQRRLERRDPLTGIANRTALARAVSAYVAGAGQSRLALLVLDLDRFKKVNEALGHKVGDRLLVEVARRLVEVAGPQDLVARLGGDEFALLVPGLPDVESAYRHAAWVAAALDEPVLLDGLSLDASGSIGVVVYPEHGHDFATLLQHADVAMYDAKYRGDGVAVYAPEADLNTPDRLGLLADLRRALDTQDAGITLHYQPQVEIATGEVVGFEALLRWYHPRRGAVDPGELIRVAEQSTVMRLLTFRVLDEAMGQLAQWGTAGAGLRIAVNVSVRDLHSGELVEWIAQRLGAYRVRPAQLQLEITEGALMADPLRVAQTLTRLRRLGVSVSLDDFGTGYSSLLHLRRLPLSEVKIDRSFVVGVATDADDAAIVRSMIEMAGALGLRVVAEGVEDDKAWRVLAAAGCDLAQGWYCAKPMPAHEVLPWLEQHRAHRAATASPVRLAGIPRPHVP